jgi:Zn-dependent protease
MTQILTSVCERCGNAVPPTALVCTNCGNLTHRAELERLFNEAIALEPVDTARAIDHWRRSLELLPPDSQQYAAIYNRLVSLTSGSAMRQPPADDSPGLAVLKTGGSMLLSILVYAVLFAPGFGVLPALMVSGGIVFLILIHELGHVAAMRYYGLSASPPIFIPFMGALINLRQPPQNAKVEAIVGIGGPITGTVGALACYAASFAFQPDSNAQVLAYFLAYIGFAINLFNLLPVPPLDGGRITAAVNPKVWMLGIAGLGAMIVNELRAGRTPVLLIFVLVYAMPRVMANLRRSRSDNPYYAISKRSAWTIGIVYVLLGLLLFGLYWLTGQAVKQFV